jgi:hypothetical protein
VNYSVEVMQLVTKVLLVIMQRIYYESTCIDNFRVEVVYSTGVIYLDCLMASGQWIER